MDNTINAKIQTPTTNRQDSERATASESVQSNPTATTNSPAEVSASVATSDRIQTSEAAQTALDRLKELLAQQPSAALAAYSKITGQATDSLLESAVSASS